MELCFRVLCTVCVLSYAVVPININCLILYSNRAAVEADKRALQSSVSSLERERAELEGDLQLLRGSLQAIQNADQHSNSLSNGKGGARQGRVSTDLAVGGVVVAPKVQYVLVEQEGRTKSQLLKVNSLYIVC
ncbi:hypothetical protein EON64_14410 [archaeon]|nr:MAG: hypothetical protein EON64_14410 [archaeon]